MITNLTEDEILEIIDRYLAMETERPSRDLVFHSKQREGFQIRLRYEVIRKNTKNTIDYVSQNQKRHRVSNNAQIYL